MSLISYVTKIHFAENVLEDALEAELDLLAMARPLILCDHGPDRSGLRERLLLSLPGCCEPTLLPLAERGASEALCGEAASLYADADADGLIAFGGSAAISLSKAVAVQVSHAGPLSLYAGTSGTQRIRAVLPPLIAIPTTASSCADVTGPAVLGTGDGVGLTLASVHLVPTVVIVDPTLTLDLSPRQTASSGMDVLTHCIETLVALAYNPPADGIARDGIRRAAAHLEASVEDGSDLMARRELMAAALDGALAGQKGLGGVHAMSHALERLSPAPLDHGALNAALLPLVLGFNEPAVAGRYREIREDLGLPAGRDVAEGVIRLRERIALPSSIKALGIEEGQLEPAAALAAADYSNRTNPRRAGPEDYLVMLSAAF